MIQTIQHSAELKSIATNNAAANKIGFWSAILSIVFAAGYDIAQLFSWLKFVTFPADQFWLFLPSLFLAPAFLIVIISLHITAGQREKIWTAIGVAFAIIYCAFATMNYFIQLTVVVPALARGEINETNLLVFKQGSFMFAIDCLGYFLHEPLHVICRIRLPRKPTKVYMCGCW